MSRGERKDKGTRGGFPIQPCIAAAGLCRFRAQVVVTWSWFAFQKEASGSSTDLGVHCAEQLGKESSTVPVIISGNSKGTICGSLASRFCMNCRQRPCDGRG